VMTGSQLPLSSPRSDARQNLIDALTCATASFKVSDNSSSSAAAVFAYMCVGGQGRGGGGCGKGGYCLTLRPRAYNHHGHHQ